MKSLYDPLSMKEHREFFLLYPYQKGYPPNIRRTYFRLLNIICLKFFDDEKDSGKFQIVDQNIEAFF